MSGGANHPGALSPAQAAALQRGAGNRAVLRRVQAMRDPSRAPPTTSGAAIHEAARLGTGGAGGALPHLGAIQRSFGAAHDLSGVRAHVGGAAVTASAAMGAHAYAYGERIAFSAAPSLRVAAHEAAHVIQQRRGVTLSGGVGRAGDRYEREADEAAERVVQGRSAAELFGGHAGAAGAVTGVQRAPAVQRLERPFSDGYATLTSDPDWLATAEAYEQRLGVYAYQHPNANAALTLALTKMEAVIRQEHDADNLDADPELGLYREVFTKDDAGSAGQVGNNLLLDEIQDLLTHGNLRERMTAFYNAAYYNSDPREPPLRGLKRIAADILLLSETATEDLADWSDWFAQLMGDDLELKSWDELVAAAMAKAQRLGLDVDDLGKKLEFLHGSWTRGGFKSAAEFFDWCAQKGGYERRVGYNFANDPFALGNLTLAQEMRGTGGIAVSQAGRVTRDDTERDAEKRTAQDYVDIDPALALSPREEAYTRSKMTGVTDATYATTRLPWITGHAYYKMSDTNQWVKEIRGRLKMPVVAGVSGTTTRMLTAFKWLHTGGDPLDFRLALMGWMLPAWDHSLYEILRGSHLADVKRPEEGKLDDVVRMYMNIPPLTTDELRANVAVDKMFPHEEIYLERAEPAASPTGFKAVFDPSHYDDDVAISGDPNVSRAHATAIFGYTTGVHKLMNALLSSPVDLNVKGKGLPNATQKMLKDNARDECRYQYLDSRPAGTLNDEEQRELERVGAGEPYDVFRKGDRSTTWRTYCRAATRTSAEVDRYIREQVNPWIDGIYLDVYQELKAHICMTNEALAQLPPAGGRVYRGTWTPKVMSRYKAGATITLSELSSSSRDEETAVGFANGGPRSDGMLIELDLANRGGRDIAAFSAIPEEQEVLLMPGTRIRVNSVAQEVRFGKTVKVVRAVEV